MATSHTDNTGHGLEKEVVSLVFFLFLPSDDSTSSCRGHSIERWRWRDKKKRWLKVQRSSNLSMVASVDPQIQPNLWNRRNKIEISLPIWSSSMELHWSYLSLQWEISISCFWLHCKLRATAVIGALGSKLNREVFVHYRSSDWSLPERQLFFLTSAPIFHLPSH